MARVTRSSARKEEGVEPPAKKESPVKKAPKAKAAKPTKQKVEKPTKQKVEKPTKKKVEKPTEEKVEAPTEEKVDKPTMKPGKKTIAKAVGDNAIVEINKEKPGKGNFVVRVSGVEEPIVELLAMKRPFPPLKALNLEDICAKVVQAIS